MIDVIRAGLVNNAPFLAKLVTAKVYYEDAPQSAKIPYVILSMIDSEINDTKHTTSDFEQNRIQVLFYAELFRDAGNSIGAQTLADLARTALDHVNVTYGATTHFCRFDSQRTFSDQIENKKVVVVEHIYEVYYNN